MGEHEMKQLVLLPSVDSVPLVGGGSRAQFRFFEFFVAQIHNENTRYAWDTL